MTKYKRVSYEFKLKDFSKVKPITVFRPIF